MNVSKTLFAQLMDYLPWSTFDRIVARYDGNRAVRTLPCAPTVSANCAITSSFGASTMNIESYCPIIE